MIAARMDLKQFEEEGYYVAEGLLDPVEDIQPVIDEYSELLDRLSNRWHSEGKLSATYEGLPFEQRLSRIAVETGGGYSRYFDISLPQANIRSDTPMHHGPAVFSLLGNPKLLDAVEQFIGPEIYSNPVQHVRIKPPERLFSEEEQLGNELVARTPWHQDQGVIREEADDSQILTAWVAMSDAPVERGCLSVGPRSHLGELRKHCYASSVQPMGILDEQLPEDRRPVPMKAGDVLFLDKLTVHGAMPNVSDDLRWSFDLRYNPTGQDTGRPWFPGFVARSRANPDSKLKDAVVWAEMWREARSQLARMEAPRFNRWDPNDPMCA